MEEENLAAVVLEAVVHLAHELAVEARLTPEVGVLQDRAPLLEVPVDHPADKFAHAVVEELLGVGDYLVPETLLDLLALHKLHGVLEVDVLLEPLVAPLVDRTHDLPDLAHPGCEVALHVLFVHQKLRLMSRHIWRSASSRTVRPPTAPS